MKSFKPFNNFDDKELEKWGLYKARMGETSYDTLKRFSKEERMQKWLKFKRKVFKAILDFPEDVLSDSKKMFIGFLGLSTMGSSLFIVGLNVTNVISSALYVSTGLITSLTGVIGATGTLGDILNDILGRK